MSYRLEPDTHIRDKFKVVLDLSNYSTKEELEHGTGVGASNLAAKKDFVALKAEDDKIEINKLLNVAKSLNNLKTKVDDLNVDQLKIVPIDLKRVSDVVIKEAGKYTKFNTLNTKVNKLHNKIPDVTTLFPISQNNTDKQSLETEIGDVDKKYQIK